MHSSLIEHRAIIRFLTKKGFSGKEIMERMAMSIIKMPLSIPLFHGRKWASEFKRGGHSLEYDPTPLGMTTSEVIPHVENLVMNYRRLKVKEMAAEVGIL